MELFFEELLDDRRLDPLFVKVSYLFVDDLENAEVSKNVFLY